MFYRFNQNNSGGVFDGYHCVIVEADSPAEANQTAVESGHVYFEDRGDCIECCGYRWREFWETDTVPDGYSIYEDVDEAVWDAKGGYFTSTGDIIVLHKNGEKVVH